MVLELGDETVRAHVADAVDVARQWLTAETRPATRGPQTTLVDAVIDPSGHFTFETTKLEPPEPSPGSKEDWHIGVFSTVLDTLVAFGPADAAREAAAAREEWYRSTDVVAEEAYFADVRAKKEWLLEDDGSARTACKEAIKTADEPLVRSTSIALLALIEGKPSIFHGALVDVVRTHQRTFKQDPECANGVFTLEGLALCRMARTYGVAVEEQPYLPVRYLAPGPLRPLRASEQR